jgi:hypothetical protein
MKQVVARRHAEAILETFDFALVHTALAALGRARSIHTPDRARARAHGLLLAVAEREKGRSIRSGGLRATHCGEHLALEHVLTAAHSGCVGLGTVEANPASHVAAVLRRFDALLVHMTMCATDWEWQCRGVPTVGQIYDCASSLLNEAATQCPPGSVLGSGGLFVRKFGRRLELEFLIEWATSEGIDEPARV